MPPFDSNTFVNMSFILDNCEHNGDGTDTFTWKACGPLTDNSKANKTHLEEAIDILNNTQKVHGFLMYKDIYDAFHMKYPEDKTTVMKYASGNWEKYHDHIQKLIDAGERQIKGAEGNVKGLIKQEEHFHNLARREQQKIEEWQITVNKLEDLIND